MRHAEKKVAEITALAAVGAAFVFVFAAIAAWANRTHSMIFVMLALSSAVAGLLSSYFLPPGFRLVRPFRTRFPRKGVKRKRRRRGG